MKSMPAFAHASASVDLIGREAFETSVSLRQNFWNPPPVPDEPTVTRVPAWAAWKSCATASVIGKTVLEPSMVMTCGPDAPPCREPPPHAKLAARVSAAAANAVNTRLFIFRGYDGAVSGGFRRR